MNNEQIANLEHLTWRDNWNGGNWSNTDCLNNPDDYNFYTMKEDEILQVDVVVKNISGVDHDMGHQYAWNAKRLFIKYGSVFGEQLIDVRNISNGYKLMYSKKDSK